MTKPRAAILSISVIEADNRVIRQASTFSEYGFDVIAFGLPSTEKRQSDFDFKIFHLGDGLSEAGNTNLKTSKHFSLKFFLLSLNSSLREKFRSTPLQGFYESASEVGKFLWRSSTYFQYLLCKMNLKSWQSIYWDNSFFREMLDQMEVELGNQQFSVIVSNDWNTLPVAKILAEKYNLALIYDSHEHALSENAHRVVHTYLIRDYIFSLERYCLSSAKLVTSVSLGIANAIKDQYRLQVPCLEIKSAPQYTEIAFRPVQVPITLYYHGYLKENRHLETLIRTLSYLDERYILVFRGGHPSSVEYERLLIKLARDLKVINRFKIEPIASHKDVFRLASSADIAFSVPPVNSLHSDMALPNKFFEYIMSGLAIFVSDVTEMGNLVRQHELGIVLKSLEPSFIAKEVEKLSIDQINLYKMNSLKLAKELCWEKEKKRYLNLLADVLEGSK